MGGPEGVVHVDLGQGGEPVGQLKAFLAGLVAEVLEQQDRAVAEGLGGLAGLVAGDVVDERDLDPQVLGQDRPDRLQRVRGVALALGRPRWSSRSPWPRGPAATAGSARRPARAGRR